MCSIFMHVHIIIHNYTCACVIHSSSLAYISIRVCIDVYYTGHIIVCIHWNDH